MPNAFSKTTLPNGLRVVTADMPSAKSVACFVMVAAGSRYETRDTNGIAHFAEHMFFKGTENRPSARDIAGEIDSIGGEFNAFTGKEYTGYYVKCAAEHRDTALDVLVDMLRHSKFEPEEIEREKGVIVEEMNMYYDTPRDYVDGVYDDLLYGDQPLGWDIIGTKDTVRAATRETFLGYLDRWYRGPRMVAGLSGAVGSDAVDRVSELLGDVPNGATGCPGPRRRGSRTRRGSRSTRRPPTRRTCAWACTAIRSAIPTGTRSCSSPPLSAAGCRRGSSPRCGSGAASPTTSTATTRPIRTPGTLFAQGGVDINRIDDAVATIVGEFGRIAAEPLEQDELEKARNFAKGRLVLSLEDPKGMISFALRDEVLEGKLREPDEVLAALDKVTVEDVHRVAQDIVRQDRLNLALIGPFDEPDRFQKLLELEVAA